MESTGAAAAAEGGPSEQLDTVKANYDDEMYKNYVLLCENPFYKYVIHYSTKKYMEDLNLEGQTMIDMAGGEGNHSRSALKLGAKKCVVADLSENFLEIGKEKDKKLGIPEGSIVYVFADCSVPKLLDEECTTGLAMHLLCYGENWEALKGMCANLYINMKPGAKALIYSCMHEADEDALLKVEGQALVKKEAAKSEEEPTRVSSLYTYKEATMLLENRYFWRRDMHIKALKEAKFSSVEVLPLLKDETYANHAELDLLLKSTDRCFLLATK